ESFGSAGVPDEVVENGSHLKSTTKSNDGLFSPDRVICDNEKLKTSGTVTLTDDQARAASLEPSSALISNKYTPFAKRPGSGVPNVNRTAKSCRASAGGGRVGRRGRRASKPPPPPSPADSSPPANAIVSSALTAVSA